MKRLLVLLVALLSLLAFASQTASAATTDLSGTGATTIVYINGDADGDRIISIVDATVIQRLLAHIITDPDGSITLRGDVNADGLFITDATLVQRYLAKYPDRYKIGEEMSKVIGGAGGVELPEDQL